ncbi:MAG: hypothetical protein IJ758_01955 [Clostridia bacterium]|nr:hypothetical protein [Clostridia bacterium]
MILVSLWCFLSSLYGLPDIKKKDSLKKYAQIPEIAASINIIDKPSDNEKTGRLMANPVVMRVRLDNIGANNMCSLTFIKSLNVHLIANIAKIVAIYLILKIVLLGKKYPKILPIKAIHVFSYGMLAMNAALNGE